MECWVPEAGEGGKREPRFPGYRVSVWDDENALEMDDCDGCTTL